MTVQRRLFSDKNSNPPSNKLPSLMPDAPVVVWPSLFKSIRNFILATFIIKPYLDKEFNLPDFISASKKAVEVVSKKLSEGDLKSLSLEGLVTRDLIPTLQKTISLMSLPQREQIAVNIDDIYFSFPYQVGIIFNDDEDSKRGEEPPLNMGSPESLQKE
ncbi:hypothetical protein JTB14_018024 [Gonioctena quinquepunctata]|nr:hypothetical protein JTB14_018024 [Gonioctena quinquepunctata]